MAGLLFIVLMQFIWSFGQAQRGTGGGAYSYSDSRGRKYSGTYNLEDGKVFPSSGDPVAFSDIVEPGYGYDYSRYGFPEEDFFPTYFSNLGNLLEEVFQSNIENQKLAFDAARKAFTLSSNQPGYYPNFATRLPPFNNFGGFPRGFRPGFPGFPNFHSMNNFPNSAFASSAIGPGFRRQIAEINPENPLSRNVNINTARYSDSASPGEGYYSVSSKSYASSSNVNGQESSHRGAETTVNDNGRVTSYKVQS